MSAGEVSGGAEMVGAGRMKSCPDSKPKAARRCPRAQEMATAGRQLQAVGAVAGAVGMGEPSALRRMV